MRKQWKLIEETIESSILNKNSKKRVLDSINRILGENLIMKKLPEISDNLDEDENLIYRDIINAINTRSE